MKHTKDVHNKNLTNNNFIHNYIINNENYLKEKEIIISKINYKKYTNTLESNKSVSNDNGKMPETS